jgi:hypothetical protein
MQHPLGAVSVQGVLHMLANLILNSYFRLALILSHFTNKKTKVQIDLRTGFKVAKLVSGEAIFFKARV